MSFSLADILFLLVIFQLFFTSGFLYTYRGGRKVSNALLATFYLAIGLDLLDNLLLIKGAYSGQPRFAFWSVWLLLLFGPLLYLYTRSILYRDFRFTRAKWVHFLPFALLFLVTEVYWQSRGAAEQQVIFHQVLTRQVPVARSWDAGLIFLQFFAYMAASFRLIGRFRKAAGQEFSDLRRVDVSWLSYSLLFFTLTMTLAALNSFIGMTPLASYWWPVFLATVLLVFVYINAVLLKALRRPELFAVLDRETTSSPAEKGVVSEAGSASDAGSEERKRVLEELQRHMETQRPWLDADLTLEQLARQLHLRPKVLSQAINEGLGRNFFEFINHYRIEESKRLLTDPPDKKITVLEVLYQVGFNSKSSFNTVFKKQTGLTPSEFKKRGGG